jgi:hypothetical protein
LIGEFVKSISDELIEMVCAQCCVSDLLDFGFLFRLPIEMGQGIAKGFPSLFFVVPQKAQPIIRISYWLASMLKPEMTGKPSR